MSGWISDTCAMYCKTCDSIIPVGELWIDDDNFVYHTICSQHVNFRKIISKKFTQETLN